MRIGWLVVLPLTAVLTDRVEASEERVDVLVIGASPSGLTAAQAARESGARRVAVVGAHREPTGRPTDRHNPVILRKRIIQILAHFGVPVGDPRYVMPFGGHTSAEVVSRGANPLEPSAHDPETLKRGRLRLASAGIGNVERGLIDAIRRRDPRGTAIALHFATPVVSIRQHERGVVARVRDPDGQVRTIRASIAYVADGAAGPVASMLGVGRSHLSAPERWGVGVYRQPGEGRHVGVEIPDGRGGTALAVRIDGQHAAINVALPEADDYSPAELDDLLTRAAGELGVAGPLLRPASRTQVVAAVGHRAAVGRVFFGGDTVHRATVFTGDGLNAAILDGLRFGQLAGPLLEASTESRFRRLRSGYERDTWRTADVVLSQHEVEEGAPIDPARLRPFRRRMPRTGKKVRSRLEKAAAAAGTAPAPNTERARRRAAIRRAKALLGARAASGPPASAPSRRAGAGTRPALPGPTTGAGGGPPAPRYRQRPRAGGR